MKETQSDNDQGWALGLPLFGETRPAAGTPMRTTSTSPEEDSPFGDASTNANSLQGRRPGFAVSSPPVVQRSVLHPNPTATRDRPPMCVVVVNRDAHSSNHGTPNSRASAPLSFSSSAFSKPFRLQPRRPVGGAAAMSGKAGGRKRTAQSMSAMGNPAGLLVDATTTSACSSVSGFDAPVSVTASHPTSCLPLGPAQSHGVAASNMTLAVTPSAFSARSAGTPPRTAVAAAGANQQQRFDLNFHCLSLQSPKPPPNRQSTTSPPASIRDSSASGSQSHSGSSSAAMVMLGSSTGSHPGSATAGIPPRSCFTPVYNSASPVHSVAGRVATTPPPLNIMGGGSGGSIMSNASPAKLAPLTVLKGGGPATAALAGKESSNNSIHSSRPPLPNSLWCSLEGSVDSPKSNDGGGEAWAGGNDPFQRHRHASMPPKTVHCRKPSSDSISTVHNSVLSPCSRPSPGGFFLMSPSAMGNLGGTTPNKQARREVATTSPGQSAAYLVAHQQQRTPKTPQTPLPRVTLTPRSNASRRSHESRGQAVAGLPRFPSPSDTDMDVTSPFLHTAAATLQDASKKDEAAVVGRRNSARGGTEKNVSAMRTLFPESSNSLALSADGSPGGNRFIPSHENYKQDGTSFGSAPGKKREPILPMMDIAVEGGDRQDDFSKRKSHHPFPDFAGGSFMGIHTKSLLTPSRSNGVLQAMMEEQGGSGRIHHGATETGSISDIDEDEGFVLASPSALEAERVASLQPARQRRRCSTPSDRQLVPSPNTSSNNLFGMNYVASNTSLFGMDIAHPPGIAGSSEDVATGTTSGVAHVPSMASKNNGETSLYWGAAERESHRMNRRKSDSSFASVGLTLDGRDLVTPPVMAQAQTPPPLPFLDGYFMPVETGVEDDATGQTRRSRNQNNICIAGADRRSVTVAIAQMAFEAQHHTEKSPVI